MRKTGIAIVMFIGLVHVLFSGAGDIKFERISIGQGLSQSTVYCIFQDSKGFMWFGTHDGLNKYDGKKFTVYTHDPDDPHSLSNKIVRTIYEDRSGSLWVGTQGGGLNRFDRQKENFTGYKYDPNNPTSLSSNFVVTIHEDRFGVLWIGTRDQGLNQMHRDKETFTRYKNDPNKPGSLGSNFFISIHEDRSGVLWIGTAGAGLNQLDRETGTFTCYKKNSHNPGSLNSNYVASIFEDSSGVLWLGTLGGLSGFHREKNVFTFYPLPRINTADTDIIISSIIEDQTGMLWIGAEAGGLFKFDRQKEQYIPIEARPTNSNKLSDHFIYSICEDKSGIIWVGTWRGGLNQFEPKKKKFTRYLHHPNQPESLSDNFVRKIYEDRSGVLWIGTARGGLNRFDGEKQTFRRYQSSPGVPNDLSNNEVLSIYQDRNGVLWIGTGGGGLNQFDRQKETFKHYTRKQGLPNNVVYGILEDNQGNLWLSTNKGISMFNPSTEIFKNFDLRDGIQGYEFNTDAYFKSQSGQMFFGGVNGLNSFYPDRIEENKYIPPVVITGFKIYNKPVDFGKDSPLQKHITETEKIILSYKHNIFSFEFAALDYTDPVKNQYMYKMEGFNREWIHLGCKNDIAFTNLDPGEYIFRVRGANSDGLWNNKGASIKIIITPPWWETWWFRGLIIILVVFLAYRWHQTTMKRLSKRLKTEAAMARFFAKYSISEGEQKILKLILKGKTNKEIEDILFISYHTVKNHIYNIYQKLGVKNRAQLINLFQESRVMKEK